MAATSFPDDCLPPKAEYESRNALFKVINAWAATKGYAFVTKRLTWEKNGQITTVYACDWACHTPPSATECQRRTATWETSCPFSVMARESISGTWTIWHSPHRRFSTHNHAPSQCPGAHPVHWHFSLDENMQITALSNAGIGSKEIQTVIWESSSLATWWDIYNCIAAVQRDAWEGQSPMHALAEQLKKEEEGRDWWSRFQTDKDEQVTALFFAHSDSISTLQAYSEVLDCTYKTNKYSMPLLNFVGVDACQWSFCIPFAFLNSETEEDYFWALEQLKCLYDAFYCNIHVFYLI